ncbi:SAV_2336 N-terminal domain-related protein [Streptomyces anulatus]|uniref:SAV_2336 N-terminal domain-related protein n=1 Tax=Streptomyces anulatus TaxID=1892 RepID=UPI00225A1757|nr:SAV_2336 N-terminal domain-related protein [Streptomyces anulatus]MCX4503127.1 SAV_2336 N-terminal domain-related protein [Streptomyces anulatus]
MTSATPSGPPTTPDAALGPPRSALTALIARLREAGVDAGAEEVADALWLARWTGPVRSRPEPWAGPERDAPESPAAPRSGSRLPETPPVPPPAADPAPVGRAVLHVPDDRRGSGDLRQGVPGAYVRVPTASTLPDPLALQRALRPLQGFRSPSPPGRGTLDEKATAHRAAETGILQPVLRPASRREARAQLLMDVSSSTVVWEQTLDELRETFLRCGAFREVRVHYLHEDPDGAPGVSTEPSPPAAPLRSPAQLTDPTGRQLTLLLSDCAGPMWRSGVLHRLLHRWATAMPVAVVQPLPQRMWRSTHLPARPGLLRRPEQQTGRLEFVSPEGRPPHTVPVPVLALHHLSMGAWARLLSGTGQLTQRAAAAWVGPGQGPAPARSGRSAVVSAPERVRVFRRHASPTAVRLAQWLTTTPLELPVMQHLQRAMLPDSGPDALAEVLLGGLLTRVEREPEGGLAYAFREGVWDELHHRLDPGDADRALNHLSRYVEGRWGRTARNFPAMAVAYLSGTVDPPGPPDGLDDPLLREFAVVSTRVLRGSLPQPRFGTERTPGRLAADARDRLGRFRRQGTARDLDLGIALLTEAAEVERRRPERSRLFADLAAALAERWEARRLGEDLSGALAAAERAVPDVPQAYGTLGTVLRNLSEELAVGGPGADAVPERFRERAGASDDPDAVRFLLLDEAQRVLGRAAAEDGYSGRSAAIARIRVLQQLGSDFGEQALRLHHPPPEGPDQWYEVMARRSLEVLDTLIASSPSPALVHLRGRSRTMLARHHADRADRPTAEDVERVRALAGPAALDLAQSLARMDHAPAVGDGRPGPDWETAWAPEPADLVEGWGALADAHELAWFGSDVATGQEEALADLAEALAVADTLPPGGHRDALRLRCLEARALVEMRRSRVPGADRRAALDRIVDTWAEVLEVLPESAPSHAGILHSHGVALMLRGQLDGSEDGLLDAVRVLRRCVAETSEKSPDLAVRRVDLGRALLFRYQVAQTVVDLYEADWIVGAAARGAASAETRAHAYGVRGEVAEALGLATSAQMRFAEAAAHFLQAADSARVAGAVAAAAGHLESRARMLERIAGPDRALVEYERALSLLADHGEEDAPVASRLRDALHRLGSGDA